MKPNLYYVSILATTILVLSGPASFATPTSPTQSTDTMDQTQTSSRAGTVTVSIGEGSNATIQHYTFTPQSVEVNAGESVTWVSPSELSDIHTVTFVQDPSIVSDILLPFAAPTGVLTELELVPPFNAGEPLIIQTPEGGEAIVALNKHAWYPTVLDANNQTTYLQGTDVQATLNGNVKVLNSGIILPPMPSANQAQPNSTETGTTGEEASVTNATASTMTNATGTTTDVLTVPDEEGMSQPTEGATSEQQLGPPFPPISSFTVTFEEPGTYPYFCAIHPWMTGQVIVRGEAPSETQTQPPTETQTQPPTETQTQPPTETQTQPPTETQPENRPETQGPGQLESPNPLFG
jgi:plastocyanin